ncbi:hypothetical protein A2331_00460 [Candidatus Falkowbacteria bacterium RIFOXYB2_FULL_34_18]|uniref:YbaK/aminoacyl-tRNA synthetase-associated domain-containing protein n=1 Tax=Candidatus Falkowbacteria bacterium RIFOXYD2_FULL_34_120 TaxID=1798007 RepID=A0A1F5TMM0_9BACT|nr:MAG: hypothetical protein A2331_00460 [Candidatus Falkowbacteria bacterium RIFOXYB2_FULL_34_18]OGF38144.1 MAG: hypothetical protein A2466_00110 [Candidatus Falkowbacteria bacterium RIFOXYC2_FULL_34_220]OGF38537.1 MAG: hypothetical protein A2515_05120 [Candidatus Falkowbacteria bacterium RIFOXYD12_FULL_34_57]OGF40212.1 MAG: hypothetical protein A2531_04635 [Candidatus Falkowbacteria bacterium RIFOXYD2_FULL_34_120]
MGKKTKISDKLIKYLEKVGVGHNILEHRTVYTAIDAAATMKKKLNEIAKSLLIKADKDYYLVLVPADNNIDFEKLKKVIGKKHQKDIKTIMIPGEKMVNNALKIKMNTLTAFGKMHKLAMIIDKRFEKLKKAVFASGSNNHSIEMAIKDFIKIEEPVIGGFGVKKKIKKQAVTKPKSRKTKTAKKQVKSRKSVNPARRSFNERKSIAKRMVKK